MQHMPGRFVIAVELEQQREIGRGRVRVLDEDPVAAQLVTKNVLFEALRDQRDFKIALIAAVGDERIVGDIIRIEWRALALRLHAEIHRAGNRHRRSICRGVVARNRRDCIIDILQAILDLVSHQ